MKLGMMTAVTSWPCRLRIDQLINGKRAMKAVTVLRIEQWLCVEAAFWMNLQNSYELDQVSEKLGKKIKRRFSVVCLGLLFDPRALASRAALGCALVLIGATSIYYIPDN
jgi:hypothetical protein